MLNECVNLKLLTYSKYANVNYNYVVHEVFLSLFLSFFPNCLGWLDTHGGGGGNWECSIFSKVPRFLLEWLESCQTYKNSNLYCLGCWVSMANRICTYPQTA